jgi:phosphoribosylformylglycinamidine synthase subunit PurL
VNAMSVGVLDINKIALAKAEGIGNPVMLVGSGTGKDGIHGATFASVELGPESESRRPNVQMGDPFQEKLLIEATLEALATGFIVGIQDMGAAGITCSTCETAAKAGTGMQIDVLKVPVRESDMTPYEIMLSESQERMLCIIDKGHEDEVASVFKKWGLNAIVIGDVTDDGFVQVYEGDKLVARVPAKSLADECPTYALEMEEPEYVRLAQSVDLSVLPEPADHNETLLSLLASPSIASKEWVYDQYDHMVQTNTAANPACDAAVLRIRGTKKAIAVTTDCNARYCYLDPFVGAQIAVAESARNLACSGARPMGVTDCLNFANPEKPQAFWQFKRAVEGLAEACEFFNTPVISGNVSFYNETPETAIYPTPVVGMLGLIEDCDKRCDQGFKMEGDVVAVLSAGRLTGDVLSLGGSEYLKVVHDMVAGAPPSLDMTSEKRVHDCLLQAISDGLLRSAHDCSEGGLAVAVTESCIGGEIGAKLEMSVPGPESAVLFGEAQSRVVVSLASNDATRLSQLAADNGVDMLIIGKVGGSRLEVKLNGVKAIDSDLEKLARAWREAIPAYMVD